jgi:hypothetical protein
MRSFSTTLMQVALMAAGMAVLLVCCVLYRAFILGMQVDFSVLRSGWEPVIGFFINEAILTMSGMSFICAVYEVVSRTGGLRTADARVGTLLALMLSVGVSALIAMLFHRGTTVAEHVAAPAGAIAFVLLGRLTVDNAIRYANYLPEEANVLSGSVASTYEQMQKRQYRETEDW